MSNLRSDLGRVNSLLDVVYVGLNAFNVMVFPIAEVDQEGLMDPTPLRLEHPLNVALVEATRFLH